MSDYAITSSRRSYGALLWLSTVIVSFGLMVGTANLNWLLTQTGIGPVVPFSLQTLGALGLGFAASRLPWSAIMVSILLYAASALIVGVPISAGNPMITGGYIVGFVLATGLITLLWPNIRTHSFIGNLFLAFMLSVLASSLVYLPGLTWLNYSLGQSWQDTMNVGLYPFIVPDLIKCAIAAVGAAAFLSRPYEAFDD